MKPEGFNEQRELIILLALCLFPKALSLYLLPKASRLMTIAFLQSFKNQIDSGQHQRNAQPLTCI